LRKDAVKAARLAAIEKNANSDNPLPEAKLHIPPVDDDSFHDGKEVLAEVSQWHKVLRASLRKTDAITSQVLDVVDKMMLIGQEHKRARAKNVCTALERITKSFGGVTMPNDTKAIQEKLVKLDQTLPYVTDVIKSITPAQPNSDDRKARKEKLLSVQPPMKTSHRSDQFGGPTTKSHMTPRLPSIGVVDPHGNLSIDENDDPERQTGQALTGSPQQKAEASTRPGTSNNSDPNDSKHSFGESLNNVSSNRRQKGVTSQNAISAFYELKRKASTSASGKSPNLAHHFMRKDRDIVGPVIISDVHARLTTNRNSSLTTARPWQNSGTRLLFCLMCWPVKSNRTTKMDWTSHSQRGM
jgi:hypothetical protein